MDELRWSELAGPIAAAIERLLPARYAAFRPVVLDGMASFLGALPAHRRAELALRQAALPADAPIERRLEELLRSSPILHKLGQTLAHHPRLDPALRASLERLESLPPCSTLADLSGELGAVPPDIELGVPIAEGSVAVVVAASAPPRGGGQRLPAVLKVLKPGIEARLDEDLAAWPELGAHLEARSRELGWSVVEWSKTLDQVRDLMLAEIDLAGEQRHLEAASALYRDDPRVAVPELLEGCGPRITVMTRIAGIKVTAARRSTDRRRAARAITAALIARPLFSVNEPALVHGDPHAGNLVWTPDGRLGVLDWALAARIDPSSLAAAAAIVLAALRLDRTGVARAVAAMAKSRCDRPALDRVAAESVRALARGTHRFTLGRSTAGDASGASDALPGIAWMASLLDHAALEAGARFDDDLLLLRKSMLTLEGVVRDLAPGYSIALDLAIAGAGRLIEEWPARLFAAPRSRQFPTHLSNLDLLSLWWLAPARARNVWRAT